VRARIIRLGGVRELAARYFTENSRTIITLATKSSAKEGAK
jgi:hypothetical protein